MNKVNKMNEKRKGGKLSVILALSVFLMVLIVELILIGNSNFVSNRIFNERIENDLTTIAKLNSNHAGILLREQIEKVELIAEDDFSENALESINLESSQKHLKALSDKLIEIKKIYKDFEEIYVLDLDGQIIASTNLETVGKNELRDIEFLDEKLETPISENYYSKILEKNVIDISVEVIDDEEKKRVGVIVVVLALKEIAEIVSAEGLGETGEVYVINKEGYFITPSKFLRGENKGVLTQQIDTKSYKECFIHKSQGITEHPIYDNYLDYRGERVIGTHAPIPESEWCLVVKIDSDEVFRISSNVFLKNQIFIPVIVLALMTLLAFNFGRFFDKRISKLRGKNRK